MEQDTCAKNSTKAEGCAVDNPKAYTPTWDTVVEFLQRSLS